MKILFITHTRIGDAILSSGLLHHLIETYPEARFTVVCGPLASSLFTALPRLDRVIVMTKQRFDGHWFDLWRQLRGTTWDIVIDLRRSLISYFIPVRRRYVVGPIAEGVHHVAHLTSLLNLPAPAAPFLYTSAHHRAAAEVLIPDGPPVLAIAPVAATEAKTWPPENFAALVKELTKTPSAPCAGWRVALFGGPGDDVRAAPLLKALSPMPHGGPITVFAEADLLTVQAALARCRAFIGNDSGLGHLAASTGIPALAIFGSTDPSRYGPWGGKVVQAEGRLSELSVARVALAVRDLIAG